ncbi:tail protein X (plasmid) [Tistrella mobilis]|uniref:tail protein X n=1 Tax=Tistrella mobilis TaxID=171437 RepID=UPI003558A8CA
MIIYRTSDGDVLDLVCWRHYGRVDVVESVLEANTGLADLGPVYSAGVSIALPDLAPEPVVQDVVRLWD